MKVLQVNCVYRKGSTGKIVYDIHRGLLSRGIESVVCYGRGEKVREPHVYKTCGELYSKANQLRSRLTGLMYGGCFFSTNRLLRVIKKERPDVVHLHSINGYFVNVYRLLSWLNRNKIRTVLTLHAEFLYTGSCGISFECEGWKSGCQKCPRWKKETKSWIWNRTHASWKRLQKAYSGFDKLTVTSVSGWLMERAKQSPLLGAFPNTVIFNGMDTAVFQPCQVEHLRKKHGLEGKKIVFHVTASFRSDAGYIKGGHYVLELAKRLSGENVVFLIAAGNFEKDLKLPENVIFLGRIADQKLLAQYYALADVTLLTSRRETFSMPVAESLCCGTPVVGFEAGGPETIAIKEYSRFVPCGDVEALLQELQETLKRGKTKGIADAAKNVYDMRKTTEQYLRLYCEGT